MMQKILRLFVALCLYSGNSFCSDEYTYNDKLDYSKDSMWYVCENGNSGVDVFYVAPTCNWDWRDEGGNVNHYMNVYDAKQRMRVDGANHLAASLFSKSCRFFSPYYRQVTMNLWIDYPREIEKYYTLSHKDIVEAFDYYMKHFNNGRPYILAGHSQGAKAILELMKHTVSKKQSKRMVAAYMFGFEIKQSDLDTYKQLKTAKDSLDCGVIVCYNSVSSPKAVSSLVEKNVACINPINWRTDATYASPKENLGSVFFDRNGVADTLYTTVGARIDTAIHSLIIDGLSDDKYYISSIGALCPKGNYHVQEINLYFLNLQKNIQQRIDAFCSKTKPMRRRR